MKKTKAKKKKYVWQAFSYDVEGCSSGVIFSTEAKARKYTLAEINREHDYRKESQQHEREEGLPKRKHDFIYRKYIEIKHNEWTDEPKGFRAGDTYVVRKVEVK